MTPTEIADCQADLLTFTQTMFHARKGAPMKPNWHQGAICAALERVVLGDTTRLIINIPPRSGKCVTMNSLILTDGGYMKAHEIRAGDFVLSHIGGQIKKQRVLGVEKYTKETVTIKSITGRSTKVSYDHPVLTQRGWVKAEDLTSEHYLIRLCSKIDGNSPLPEAELDFITMMLFEGGTSNQNGKNIRFASDNNKALDCFLDCCKELGIAVKRYDESRYDYSVMGGNSGLAAKLIKKHGLMGCLAKNKRLPPAFFDLPLAQKYRFIGLMVATDGYVNQNGEIGVTLASEGLVDDISLLLDTCGVTAFKYSKQNGYAGAYTLIISTTQAQDLSRKIDCLHKQESLIARLAQTERRGSPLLGYPHDAAKGLTYKCKIAKPKIDFKNGKGIISHAKFARMVEEIDPTLAAKWIKKDFIYDRVKCVEKSGVDDVYHLSVDADSYDEKNYISDGYVVHNTELAVVNFIAWATGIYPDSEWIHASYSKRLATNNAYGVREVMRHEVYQKIFPWVKIRDDSSAKDEFRTEQGGVVYATGSEGSITGRGAGGMSGRFQGAIVIDDPHKPGEANSAVMRQNVIDWFGTTMESRKNRPDTPIIVIKQRLHESDLSGWLLGGGNGEHWDHLCIPAENEQGESFWPEQFPLDMLERLKASNSYVYAGQYLQTPAPLGGGVFKEEWLRYWTTLPKIEYCMIYSDTAHKTGQENDRSWFQLWGKGKDGNAYLIDMIMGRWESPQLLANAKAFWDKCRATAPATVRKLKIEDKASGIGLVQQLKQEGIPVEGIPRNRDKLTRGYDTAPMVEAGRVYLPERHPALSDMLHEISLFPVASHDDAVDPFMDAIQDMLIEVGHYSWSGFA